MAGGAGTRAPVKRRAGAANTPEPKPWAVRGLPPDCSRNMPPAQHALSSLPSGPGAARRSAEPSAPRRAQVRPPPAQRERAGAPRRGRGLPGSSAGVGCGAVWSGGRKEGRKEKESKKASGEPEGEKKAEAVRRAALPSPASLSPLPPLRSARGKPVSAECGVCEVEGKYRPPAALRARRPAPAAPRAAPGRGRPRAPPWAAAVALEVPSCRRGSGQRKTRCCSLSLRATGEFRGEAEWFGTGHVSDGRQIPKLESDKK